MEVCRTWATGGGDGPETADCDTKSGESGRISRDSAGLPLQVTYGCKGIALEVEESGTVCRECSQKALAYERVRAVDVGR
jgi:hypothetical protein